MSDMLDPISNSLIEATTGFALNKIIDGVNKNRKKNNSIEPAPAVHFFTTVKNGVEEVHLQIEDKSNNWLETEIRVTSDFSKFITLSDGNVKQPIIDPNSLGSPILIGRFDELAETLSESSIEIGIFYKSTDRDEKFSYKSIFSGSETDFRKKLNELNESFLNIRIDKVAYQDSLKSLEQFADHLIDSALSRTALSDKKSYANQLKNWKAELLSSDNLDDKRDDMFRVKYGFTKITLENSSLHRSYKNLKITITLPETVRVIDSNPNSKIPKIPSFIDKSFGSYGGFNVPSVPSFIGAFDDNLNMEYPPVFRKDDPIIEHQKVGANHVLNIRVPLIYAQDSIELSSEWDYLMIVTSAIDEAFPIKMNMEIRDSESGVRKRVIEVPRTALAS